MACMSRVWRAGAVLVALAWLPSGGCSSSGDAQSLAGNGGGISRGGSQGEPTVVMPGPDGSGGAESAALNPLCGTGRCVPDAALACFGYEPAAGGAGQAGGGEAGGSAGDESGGSGTGGADTGGASGEATAHGGALGSGDATGGDGGAPAAGIGAAAAGEAGSGAGAGGEAPAAPLPYACHVTLAGAEPERVCLSAGLGSANDPCFSAVDCRPGLACVSEGEGKGGRCLTYCCTGDSSCKLGTYCAERKLRVADDRSSTPAPRVPVCVPADACSLEEVYPCPEGADCRCEGGTACMVVRADGTTTCLEPGEGKQGEACPCAWNHVCSSATQTCVKICHIDSTSNECGNQRCQASSELPQDFGVCVGPT
jgi:hypothetical protein